MVWNTWNTRLLQQALEEIDESLDDLRKLFLLSVEKPSIQPN